MPKTDEEKVIARRIKKLERLADDYEGANYHTECEWVTDMAEAIRKKPEKFVTADDVINYIVKNWAV